MKLFFIVILMFLFSEEILAQKNSSQVTDKTINNVSSWINNGSNEKVNGQAQDSSFLNAKKQSEKITKKQLKNSNPVSDNQSKTDSSKKVQDKTELVSKRDANSRTYLNADGSLTKVQTNGSSNYKDNTGKWMPLNGNLSLSKTNNGMYEISETDLPISIDITNGATSMALEKNKFLKFGGNVDLLVLDTSFTEVFGNEPSGDYYLEYKNYYEKDSTREKFYLKKYDDSIKITSYTLVLNIPEF